MTMIPSFGNRQNLFYIRRTEPEMGRTDDLWFNPDNESWSVYDGSAWVPLAPGAGDGDMTRAVYDPQNILADAFARANHTGAQAQSTVTGLETDQATQDGRLDALEAVPEGMEKTVYDPQNVAGDAFARANHTGAQAQSTVTGLETDQATQDGRLDALEAAPGGGANLSIVNRNANTLTVASDSGDDAIVPEATPTLAGGLAAADKASINALQSAAFAPTTDFATAAQGALADSALQTGDVGDAAFKNVGTGAGDVAAGDAVSTHDGDEAAHGGDLAKVKVSATDTTAKHLFDTLFSSDVSVSFTLSGGGGNEQIDVKSTGGTGSSTFVGLTDTPNDYVGNAGKLVKVDPTGSFLIFGDPSGTTVSWGDIQGDISNQTDLQNQQDAQDAATALNTTHRTGAGNGASAHVSGSDRTGWDAAAADSHTHANKSVLDGVTAAGDGTGLLTNDGTYKDEADLPISTAAQGAFDDRYTKTEQDATDGAQDSVIAANTTHRTGAGDGASAHVSGGDRTAWDAAAADSHTHANKAVLDGITGAGDGSSLLTNNGGYKAEADLPISTAVQTALDLKSDEPHDHDGDYDALGAAAGVDAALTTHKSSVDHDGRYALNTVTFTGLNSITGGGDHTTNRTFSLVNDADVPGNDQFYGTNGAGAKGWYNLPSGSGWADESEVKSWKDRPNVITADTDQVYSIPITDGQVAVVNHTFAGGLTFNFTVVLGVGDARSFWVRYKNAGSQAPTWQINGVAVDLQVEGYAVGDQMSLQFYVDENEAIMLSANSLVAP